MANKNYDPNARYDCGPGAAGTGRKTYPAPSTNTGMASDGSDVNSDLRHGFSAAGVPRTNTGPNVAGAPRSYNND